MEDKEVKQMIFGVRMTQARFHFFNKPQCINSTKSNDINSGTTLANEIRMRQI